jgi:hypothetical protein
METRQKTMFAGLAVIAAAVVLFILLKPGGSDDEAPVEPAAPVTAAEQGTTGQKPDDRPAGQPSSPKVPTVEFRNGEPVGGVLGIDVDKGDPIRFRVRSDIADEVHIHGFDISREVPAGGSVTFSFQADITGIYEAEMEQLGVQIVELQVNP